MREPSLADLVYYLKTYKRILKNHPEKADLLNKRIKETEKRILEIVEKEY